MVVRSQAEERTRIPERLLQTLFEHTADYSLHLATGRPFGSKISVVQWKDRASGLLIKGRDPIADGGGNHVEQTIRGEAGVLQDQCR